MTLSWRIFAHGDSETHFLGWREMKTGNKHASSAQSAEKTANEKTPRTVLLIEDERGFQVIFSDIITYGGYNVVEANDGEEGLNRAKSTKPDLILLDLMLPKINGFEVLKKLRADEATRTIPVIIISVLDDSSSRATGMKLGANDYVVKSHLSHKQILNKISSLLNR